MIGFGEAFTRVQTLPALSLFRTMALEAGTLKYGIHLGGEIHGSMGRQREQEKKEAHEPAMNEAEAARLSRCRRRVAGK